MDFGFHRSDDFLREYQNFAIYYSDPKNYMLKAIFIPLVRFLKASATAKHQNKIINIIKMIRIFVLRAYNKYQTIKRIILTNKQYNYCIERYLMQQFIMFNLK